MIIDIQGGEKIWEKSRNFKYIFIEVSNMDVLKYRLRKRGQETEEQIKIRLKTADKEIRMLDGLQHIY